VLGTTPTPFRTVIGEPTLPDAGNGSNAGGGNAGLLAGGLAAVFGALALVAFGRATMRRR